MSVKKYATSDGEVRWYASIRYTDWTGKRRQKKREGFVLKREAQDWEAEFLVKNTRNCDMLFSSLMEYYRADQLHRVREGTQETEDSIIDTWLLPYFGKLQVNQIDAMTIRLWQNELMSTVNSKTGKPYAQTYLRSINARLSAVMNYAVRFYNLQHNPCNSAGYMGKSKPGEMKFWTLDQFNLFISDVNKPAYRVAFLILYWTGMREGECLALTPADLLHLKTFKVEKTHHRRNGQDKAGPPKSDRGYRELSMPDDVCDEVNGYLKSLYEIQPHERIFYFGKGSLGVEKMRHEQALGLPHIRIHDLRHSHAALLVELGYDIPAVAERLGETIEVAMKHYIHLYPKKMDHVLSSLNNASQNGLSPQEATASKKG